MSSIFSTASTASLISHNKKPSKDYSAAFASLQSQFGFGATAPVVATTSKKVKSQKTKPTRPTQPAEGPSSATNKDWSLAFANLQSQYGYSGSAPYQATVCGKAST